MNYYLVDDCKRTTGAYSVECVGRCEEDAIRVMRERWGKLTSDERDQRGRFLIAEGYYNSDGFVENYVVFSFKHNY